MENFTYDITPEDSLAVITQQRDALFNQVTTTQVELYKSRNIIQHLNEQLSEAKAELAEQHTKSVTPKVKAKKAA